jgi:hypothetical protein
MPATYQLIASTLTPSATSEVVFSTIPQTYTDLILVCSVKANGAGIGLQMRFNNDTSANYSATSIYQADSGPAASARDSNANQISIAWFGSASTDSHISETRIYQYTDTSSYKTVSIRSATLTRGIARTVGRYMGSTNAVTTLTVTSGSAWAAGGSVALYGIKSA